MQASVPKLVCAAYATALLFAACGSDDEPLADGGSPVTAAGSGAGAGAGAANGGRTSSEAGTVAAGRAGANAMSAAAGRRGPQPSEAGAGAAAPAAGAPGMMAAAGSGAATAGASGAAGGGAPPAAAGSGGTMPPAVACNPADKKPDPVPASFTQIMGYQRLMKAPTTGPSPAVLEEDPGLPDWTVYRPEMLGGESKHPVLAWGNGGCLRNGTLYGPWLLELASHGYIVLADGPPTEAGSDPVGAGMRAGADGTVLMGAIEWLIAENDRPCSQYYQKVQTDKLAVAGQSCGGLMALASAGDKRVTTAIIGNSGLFAADQRTYTALHGPIAYLIGGPNDIAYSNAERDFMNIDNVPIFYANMDVGHGGTWNAPNGGEFGRVGLAWLNWHLRGDMMASKLFVGADCELCKAPSMWTVEKKMID
jgi:hypothetical protein